MAIRHCARHAVDHSPARHVIVGSGRERRQDQQQEEAAHRRPPGGSEKTIRADPPRGGGRSGQNVECAPPTEEPQPVGVATYWRPFAIYVTEEPRWPAPVWKLHSRFPLRASRAKKFPSGSPLNKTSPAVTRIEAKNQVVAGNVHFCTPERGS